MFGLCFAMMIACFDGTIVGTCGTVIAEELNGLGLYSWMVTAFMLCETVMIPISGKLSDLYGRKPLFLIGLTLFVAGSLIAGMSTSMEMLIVCRGIQGLGGGILIPVATAAVADLYAPEARAKMQGILGAIFGVGSGIGPLIGGYITEYVDWRWVFYINIPLAIVAYALTLKKFPTPILDEKPSVDYIGMAILSVLLIDVLLYFEFGGNKFEWLGLQGILMIAFALVLLVVFIKQEMRAREPVLSPKLIHNKTVVMAAVFMFIFGIGMIGAMIYSNMFAILILNLTTLEAGYYSLAMVAGMMITALISGALVQRTGYKIWLTMGPIIAFIGLYLMSRMTIGTDLTYYAMCLFVLGFGLGCMMAVIMTGVQNSSKSNEIGMSTSSVNLLRSIGSTMGTAIFSMLITSRLNGEFAANVPADVVSILPSGTEALNYLGSQEFVNQLLEMGYTYPDGVMGVFHDILLSFANSVDFAFIAGGCIMVTTAIIGILFKVQKPVEDEPAVEAAE